MRILLATAGSRGDVEPFAALGRAARRAGHEVRLLAPDNSGVDPADLDVASLGVDWSRMAQAEGVSAGAAARAYRTVIRPAMHAVLVGGARAALDYRPDVIVHHPKILSAPLVADALGVPHVLAELVPSVTPTTAFPAVGTSTRDLGPLNRLTYAAAGAARVMFRRDLKEVRDLLGVARRPVSTPAATLVPVSPAILPRPHDWPGTVHLTGPWFAPGPASQPAPEVDAFLAQGPFVTAGFGSMSLAGAEERGRAVVQAARERGLRCLVVTGLGGLSVPAELRGPDVLVVASTPYRAVLPRAAAAVHHGGIGTTQTATAAGTPSVVVPFLGDQPFWGARLHEAGLAPAPIPARRLTADALSAALARVDDHRAAVGEAARAMSTEDGTRAALRVLERVTSSGRRRG